MDSQSNIGDYVLSRKPVYHATEGNIRVISGPNDTWFYQKKVEEMGTREKDCWQTEIEFDSFTSAMRQLNV